MSFPLQTDLFAPWAPSCSYGLLYEPSGQPVLPVCEGGWQAAGDMAKTLTSHQGCDKLSPQGPQARTGLEGFPAQLRTSLPQPYSEESPVSRAEV